MRLMEGLTGNCSVRYGGGQAFLRPQQYPGNLGDR